MKIAVLGATGMIGSQIVNEALSRGHTVTAVVRDMARVTQSHPNLAIQIGNAVDHASVAANIAGHDAVVGSITGRRDSDARQPVLAATTLLAAAEQADVARVFWVGGAGSLEIAPGVRLLDSPQFAVPEEFMPEILAAAEILDLFRANTTLDWTYLSPAIIIAPGTRTGKYQAGGDQLLFDAQGQSAISVEDFAVAVIDELEQPKHIRSRFTVAN